MSTTKISSFFHALDSENPKVAKETVNKLLKKNPSSIHYQLLECYYKLKIDHNYQEAYDKSLDLVTNPANYNQLADTQVLTLLLDIFNQSNHANDVSKIFELLLKKQPFNTSLINYWFHYSLTNLNIPSLQKASFHLQKVTSNDEKHHASLAAAYNFYLATINNHNVMEKNLFPQLGLKLLNTVEPLKSDQEIFIKVKLLIACNQVDQAIEVIAKLIDTKKFNEIDITLVLIYLELLHQTNNYQKIHDFTNHVLFDQKFNDFNFWNYWLLAASKLGNQEVLKSMENLPSELKTSRNVLLTYINCGFLFKDDELIKKSVAQYYEYYGNKKCAYSDLIKYVKNPAFDTQWFINDLLLGKYYKDLGLDTKLSQKTKSTIQEVTMLVNLQKFKFLQNEPHLLSGTGSKEYIAENIKIFNYCYDNYLVHNKDLLKTDYFIGNELLIMNLQVELSANFSKQSVIRQVIILRYVLSFSPEDFIVKLWLMKLYNYLNLATLTAETFNSLSIKNVQIDTLNHYLSTRMASTFPDMDKYINSVILKNLKFYDDSQHDYLIHFLNNCYTNESFTKIEKYFEFMKKLAASYEKFYSFAELMEIEELTSGRTKFADQKKSNYDYSNLIKLNTNNNIIQGKKASTNDHDHVHDSILSFNTTGEICNNSSPTDYQWSYSDNRDFTTEWNAGIGHILRSLDTKLSVGPRTGDQYLKLKNLRHLLLKSPIDFDGKGNSKLFDSFEKILVETSQELLDKQFTEVERLEIDLYYNFWKLVRSLLSNDKKEIIDQQLAAISTIFATIIGEFGKITAAYVDVVNWEVAHKYITTIRLYKSFNKSFKAYKQHFPRLFNKNHPQYQGMSTHVIDHLSELQKSIQDSHNDNRLKQISVKNKTMLNGLASTMITEDEQLKKLNIDGNFTKEVFKVVEARYETIFQLLNRV
ncbi:hypothetical protein DASC09_043410 [Saccharomycopsis crataegensis]|uniref:Uncharacterized protein n=1 Tax=Saccharomycopsis crataegensis TaxID=43959 RepID=A0AAV5QQK8_9ASCO|nr:hypothetical protein DASC09_043410 [Saccharomycopsis crataegensis]